jgi:hypothetical protein
MPSLAPLTVLVCLSIGFAGAALATGRSQPRIYYCPNGAQDTPCPVPKPTVVTPPPPPPCNPGKEHLKRADYAERQFLERYPDEGAHRRFEVAELQPVVDRIRASMKRFDDLAEERKPLERELAFYPKGPLPSWLKTKVDANDAQFAALTDIFSDQKQSIEGIQARFRCERATFGKMWTPGTPSGSSACDRPTCAAPL